MSETLKAPGVSEDRTEQVRKLSLTPEQFASETGANEGFSPKHPGKWMLFWKTDVCEKDEYFSHFPHMDLGEARRVWLAMEEHFLEKYKAFVRVWAEWGSSGIWAPPYPGSRVAGGMLDYESLELPPDLVSRFTKWQDQYWEAEPLGAPGTFDYTAYYAVGTELAKELKKHLGESVYVECDELMELLCDGTSVDCRARLGLAG